MKTSGLLLDRAWIWLDFPDFKHDYIKEAYWSDVCFASHCSWTGDFHSDWYYFVATVLMMTSSNGNIFRVTGPLCGEFTGPGEFRTQRPVTQSFDVFFDLRLNKRLSKQPWGWWFETPSWSLWRQCNVKTPQPPLFQHTATILWGQVTIIPNIKYQDHLNSRGPFY